LVGFDARNSMLRTIIFTRYGEICRLHFVGF
jgi:hypothetical protein